MSKIDKNELKLELNKNTKHIIVSDDKNWKNFSEENDGIFFMIGCGSRRKLLTDIFSKAAKYGQKLIVLCDYGFSNTSLRLPLMEEIREKSLLFGYNPTTMETSEVKIWEE